MTHTSTKANQGGNGITEAGRVQCSFQNLLYSTIEQDFFETFL